MINSLDQAEPILAISRFHGMEFSLFLFMEKEQEKLQEQQAPLKNHDHAFVQVGKDGKPVIPQTDEQKHEQTKDDERTTTLDKR